MNPLHDEKSLLARAGAGDSAALGEVLSQHQHRLSQMVRLRLDPRLRQRLNPSDVLQDVSIEAARRLRSYLEQPDVPFFVWLRFLAGQRIAQLHRQHLGTQSRDADREVSFHNNTLPAIDSAVIAAKLVGHLTSPSMAAQKAELRRSLHAALESMEPIDREILALRNFEQLTNLEVAETLGLSRTAASNRYIRALERLRNLLANDGGSENET